MKALSNLFNILIPGMLVLFSAHSFANSNNSVNNNTFIPSEINSKVVNNNSHPDAVTNYFLNNLRDESGNENFY